MTASWSRLSRIYTNKKVNRRVSRLDIDKKAKGRLYSLSNKQIQAFDAQPLKTQPQTISGQSKSNSGQLKKLSSPAFRLWSAIDVPYIKIQHRYNQIFEKELGKTGVYNGRFGTMESSGMVSITYESFREFVGKTRDGGVKEISSKNNNRDIDSGYEADSDRSTSRTITIRSSPSIPFPVYTEPIPKFKLAKLVAVFGEGTAKEEEVDMSEYEDGVFEYIMMKIKGQCFTWMDGFRAEWEPVYDY